METQKAPATDENINNSEANKPEDASVEDGVAIAAENEMAAAVESAADDDNPDDVDYAYNQDIANTINETAMPAEPNAAQSKSEPPKDAAKAEPSDSLSDAVDIGWLDYGKAEFYEGAGGFTGLRYDGKDYKRIQLRRALPVQNPSEYISVADRENKEIAIIRALTDLKDDQLRIVSDELNRRYYCPEILEIKSVRDKLGYVYMEMVVYAGGERHERNAAINDVNKNIRLLDANRLIVFDVDGNRFMVNSLDKLDKKSLKRLEPYMF